MLLLILVVVPPLAWMIVKPVRVVKPEFAGVTCVSRALCLDDTSRTAEAQALVADAHAFVRDNLAEVSGTPRFVFCASAQCAERFGLGGRQGVTMGTFGTVLGPNAWSDTFVRHELIHYVQAKKLGVLSLLTKPTWWVEGMAYALSGDPRDGLPQPADSYRKRFFAWQKSVGKDAVWQEAGKL